MDVLKTRFESSEVLAWRRKPRQNLDTFEAPDTNTAPTSSRRKIKIRVNQPATTTTMANFLSTSKTSEQINERVAPLVEPPSVHYVTTGKEVDLSREANLLATRSLSPVRTTTTKARLVATAAAATASRCCRQSLASTASPKMLRQIGRRCRSRCNNIGMLQLVGMLVIIITLTFAGKYHLIAH